ncbi:MAG: diguanylate cyclase [Thermoflavifilum sp.]|nr:diguanylate cyclase [Thermoflavifilum sp.]MCL6514711.1 diguanylate cyclase [Alicyclobacillus sp.]
MLDTLFINLCVIFTLTISGFWVLRRMTLRRPLSRPVRMAAAGFVAGVMGVVLMYHAVPVPGSRMIIDLRHVPVIVAAVLGGPVAGSVAGVVEALARSLLFGVSSTSLVFGLNMLVIGLVAPWLVRLARRLRYRLALGNLYALLQISVLVMAYAAPSARVVTLRLLAWQWLTSFIAVYASAWLVDMVEQYADRHDELQRLSSSDHLTGLANLRRFEATMALHLERAARQGTAVALLLFDIDHFKKVNDTYGHAAGDAALREFAAALQRSCRPGDVAARIGGEEFAILAPGASLPAAVQVAERVRVAVEEQGGQLPDGQRLHLTVSAGVAVYPDTCPRPEHLRQQSDDALYAAKRAGRNLVIAAVRES